MNKDIKEKWIAALESGDYVQGTGLLRTSDNRFCCLGVLCDVYDKNSDEQGWSQMAAGGNWFFDDEMGVLPIVVQEWAGLDHDAGDYTESGRPLAWLTQDNDNGKTFQEIADIIREKF